MVTVMGKFSVTLMFIGLIGLMMSCSHVEMMDHEDPVKPKAKEIDTQMANRLKHVNRMWYSIATN